MSALGGTREQLDELARRFWCKARPTPPPAHASSLGPCWGWTFGTFSTGYGVFQFLGKARKAHRVAWELTNGPMPDGMIVLHKCDNPVCINPDHLTIGTQADNRADMESKGRRARGEQNGCAKLTENQALEVRSSDATQSAEARRFGVSPTTIARIRRRETWRHL